MFPSSMLNHLNNISEHTQKVQAQNVVLGQSIISGSGRIGIVVSMSITRRGRRKIKGVACSYALTILEIDKIRTLRLRPTGCVRTLLNSVKH